MGPRSQCWMTPLYWGPKAKEAEEEVLRTIREGKPLNGLYLITLATNPAEQLDILPSVFLVQPAVRRRLPSLVGIAHGREEAMDLIETIASDTYRKTGTAHLRSFLTEKLAQRAEAAE